MRRLCRRLAVAGLPPSVSCWAARLAPGFVLTYDMVWVPDLAVRGDFLGLGSSLPRAVPSDMVVALLDEVVPGMVLQKAVLVGTLVVAGTGAWRLVGLAGLVGRSGVLAGLAASTLYVWNPFVAERLGIGHWPLLMTYAALPWIHLHARRLAAGERSLAAAGPVAGLREPEPGGRDRGRRVRRRGRRGGGSGGRALRGVDGGRRRCTQRAVDRCRRAARRRRGERRRSP